MPDSRPRPLMPRPPPAIVLSTLNAKFIHASLGLRYLLANMGELRPLTALCEFTIARPTGEIVDELLQLLGEAPAGEFTSDLARNSAIIGFGVYIWNVRQTTEVVRALKTRCPAIRIVLGGPEVSHETVAQEIVRLADHVITGWGDLSFAALCHALLHGPMPLNKIIAGAQPPLDNIAWPYAEYTDADLKHRLLYVEASRGCPFKCEFCLSALDKTAWAFDLDVFLTQMHTLYQRGARNFKFVDRTFNLKIDASIRILEFFLERLPVDEAGGLFVHFEVIPDQLPERLKTVIARFPPGVLQFEIGVQTFNADVQALISRRQDNSLTEANLRWLVNESKAHIHADLIFGLPGETLESFADGFDRLYALKPHEIQLGLLKRLRGTPISRHGMKFEMVYDDQPPYTIRSTAAVDHTTVQHFMRFARYWDLIANSGRFARALELLLAPPLPSPFHAFMDFTNWLWQRSNQTSGFSPEVLVDQLHDYLEQQGVLDPAKVRAALLADYIDSGARGSPRSLKEFLPKRAPPVSTPRALAQRQERHLATRQTCD